MLLYVGSYPWLKSPLTQQQFKVLLSIKYNIDDSEDFAIKCVRRIKNVSYGSSLCLLTIVSFKIDNDREKYVHNS